MVHMFNDTIPMQYRSNNHDVFIVIFLVYYFKYHPTLCPHISNVFYYADVFVESLLNALQCYDVF